MLSTNYITVPAQDSPLYAKPKSHWHEWEPLTFLQYLKGPHGTFGHGLPENIFVIC
jgi:hypothetical protein